jgi:hypothetical protein
MSELIVKYAGPGLATLYTQLTASTEQPIEFLDPLCTAAKLAVLSLKPKDTRVSIRNNGIYIQEPTMIQGAQRWWSGDARSHLHQLRLPLLYFRGLQLSFVESDSIKIEPQIFTYLSALMVKGLMNLKVTYETAKKTGSMIKNCLDDYVKTLTHPYSKAEYEAELKEIGKPTLFVIYNEFMKKWKKDDLNTIMMIFGLIHKDKSANYNNEIANMIDHFIMAKDFEIDSMRPG